LHRGAAVIVGDSPGRAGRPHMLELLNTRHPEIPYTIRTEKGAAAVTGYRHPLISETAAPASVRPCDVTLFEFNLVKLK
jgi:hypothetical protein